MPAATSNVITATISAPALVLAAIVQDEGSIGGHLFNWNALSWGGGPDADHYDIWRNLNSAGFEFLTTVSGATNTYNDEALAADWVFGTYEYFVLAKDASDDTLATSNTEGTTWSAPPVGFQVTSGIGQEGSFPFSGVWESAGVGFSFDGFGVYTPTWDSGSVTPSEFSGETLVVAGVVTGSGYDGTPASPFIMISFPAGMNQDFFSSVEIQKTGGSLFTFDSSAADFNPTPPPGFSTPNQTIWAWPIASGTAGNYFVNGVVTTVTVNP